MSTNKEALARIKINKLLKEAGWRFFDNENGPANVVLELNVKLSQKEIDEFGNDFEKTKNGFVDFLLLDENGFPLVVLEAKSQSKNPLDGKEQARKYACSLNVRFVILSNGDIHYFWDIETGNPEIITEFPTLESLKHRRKFKPDIKRLANEYIDKYFIVETQDPFYMEDPAFINQETRTHYIKIKNLRVLRDYQLRAIRALQQAAKDGKTRFLFEMATGTGKTLVAAAVIKLFLKTGNARRVLFLVDRIELENQAYKSFVQYLKNDYTTVIYKQNRDDWRKAEIVVTTIQSLMVQNKYKKLFSPTDFDLVISDEAHRSIGGNSRAVFEYFVGFKLGLTATPKNYLKNINPEELSSNDIRAWERRQLLDTYKTFGCESGEPTFRYSLLDGVRDGYLINPYVYDARTEITTKLLSEEGYSVLEKDEEGNLVEKIFVYKDFERKFFSEKTNRVFCKAFLENAMRDPISKELGKSIVFCVSQKHAAKITQILNEMAHSLWPGKYNSDFAVQVTSSIPDAQQFAIAFSNNNLNGHTRFLENYKTSKTRVCVTVGMMTTGYDCPDILNLALLRPIFSPTDFVQIKGRGTRKYTFKYTDANGETYEIEKEKFALFDFFANYEFFEEKYNYDEILKLPQIKSHKDNTEDGSGTNSRPKDPDSVEVFDPDKVKTLDKISIGNEGMKVDRELFQKAKETIQKDPEIKTAVENEQWERAVSILRVKYENKPKLYLTLEKIRRSVNLDRRISWREFLEVVFGRLDRFKRKNELLEDECDKFISIYKPDNDLVPIIKNFLKNYVSDEDFRKIINKGSFAQLNFYPLFTLDELATLGEWRNIIVEYVKDYVPLNTYIS